MRSVFENLLNVEELETNTGLGKGAYLGMPGSSVNRKTGDWRTLKPVKNDKCIHCMICWANCPDSSIIVKEGKMIGIDYEHCKGCGICVSVCPVKGKAIEMIQEEK
jgi:pyruvate ferredoxin oxidoreductase delta subunit